MRRSTFKAPSYVTVIWSYRVGKKRSDSWGWKQPIFADRLIFWKDLYQTSRLWIVSWRLYNFNCHSVKITFVIWSDHWRIRRMWIGFDFYTATILHPLICQRKSKRFVVVLLLVFLFLLLLYFCSSWLLYNIQRYIGIMIYVIELWITKIKYNYNSKEKVSKSVERLGSVCNLFESWQR